MFDAVVQVFDPVAPDIGGGIYIYIFIVPVPTSIRSQTPYLSKRDPCPKTQKMTPSDKKPQYPFFK
jgi:hypothetical protein